MTGDQQGPACEAPAADAAPGGPYLPEYPVAEIGEILQALADPVRLSMVRALAQGGEQYCGALEAPVTKATMTHHIRTLKFCGLVGSRMEGTRKYLHLRRDAVDAVYPGLLDSVLQGRREPAEAR